MATDMTILTQYKENRTSHKLLGSLLILTGLLATACDAAGLEQPNCVDEGIALRPTATRQLDPDLLSPPVPPAVVTTQLIAPLLFRSPRQ